jgi:hypothetical protein
MKHDIGIKLNECNSEIRCPFALPFILVVTRSFLSMTLEITHIVYVTKSIEVHDVEIEGNTLLRYYLSLFATMFQQH